MIFHVKKSGQSYKTLARNNVSEEEAGGFSRQQFDDFIELRLRWSLAPSPRQTKEDSSSEIQENTANHLLPLVNSMTIDLT